MLEARRMGWRCEWRVTCDQCSTKGPRGPEQDSKSAEKRAVKLGWVAWEGVYGRFHACPACKAALNDDLKASLTDSNEVRS